MRSTRRRGELVLTSIAATILLAVILPASAPATSSEEVPHVAGLVVDYGDGRVAYALVPFDEEELSGIELLRRSGLSLLTVPFGGMGEGICAIEETGCDLSACRARLCQTGDPDSPFWHYAQLGQDGTWTTSPLGASSSTVTDGGIDAWAWSDSDPAPGTLSLGDIADIIGVDDADLVAGEPVSVTVGEEVTREASTRNETLLAAAVVGGVLALGGVALARARRGAKA
jgi:hypothetical protein